MISTLDNIKSFLMDTLKDDHPEDNRKQKYLDALSGIGIHGVRNFIVGLLENGIPNEIVENSYFHPNKFFKLGICRLSNQVKLRLHFWNKEHLEVQTPIHFHAWDFASLLISGSYIHDIFRVSDLDEAVIEEIEHCKQSNSTKIFKDIYGLYRIPKRNKNLGKFQPEWVRYVKAEKMISRLERQGSSYFIDMKYPHSITINLNEVGSMITLVLTSATCPENLFTFQPLNQSKSFDNPSPNVDEATVKKQLEIILEEIDKANGGQSE